MGEKQEYEVHPNEWPKFLTADRRRHFERIGEELVSFDVSHHNYRDPEKHFAAIYWLGDRRRARQAQQNQLLKVARTTLAIAALTLVVAILSS